MREVLHETPPGQLADQEPLEVAAGQLDVAVVQAGDLQGLGQGGVGLDQGRHLYVGVALLGLVKVLRPFEKCQKGRGKDGEKGRTRPTLFVGL